MLSHSIVILSIGTIIDLWLNHIAKIRAQFPDFESWFLFSLVSLFSSHDISIVVLDQHSLTSCQFLLSLF